MNPRTRNTIVAVVVALVMLCIVVSCLGLAASGRLARVSDAVFGNPTTSKGGDPNTDPAGNPQSTLVPVPTAQQVKAPANATNAILTATKLLAQYKWSDQAEAAFVKQYGFTNEQMANFDGGMNHWTSGHGSCDNNNDPKQREYCLVPSMVDQNTLVAYVVDAAGLYMDPQHSSHLSGFIAVDTVPYSMKDGGLLTLHSDMAESDAALAIASRLFWANRPGLSAEKAIASKPTRRLPITVQMGS